MWGFGNSPPPEQRFCCLSVVISTVLLYTSRTTTLCSLLDCRNMRNKQQPFFARNHRTKQLAAFCASQKRIARKLMYQELTANKSTRRTTSAHSPAIPCAETPAVVPSETAGRKVTAAAHTRGMAILPAKLSVGRRSLLLLVLLRWWRWWCRCLVRLSKEEGGGGGRGG